MLLLANHFLRQFSQAMNKSIQGFSRAAAAQLQAHHWPGNVRELRNVIERAAILENSAEIMPESLPDFQLETRLRKRSDVLPANQSLDELMANYEREIMTTALECNHFSLTRTAEQLKISRHALRYRMQRLNICPETAFEEEPTAASGKDSSR